MAAGSPFALAQSVAMGGTIDTLPLGFVGMTAAVPVHLAVRNHLNKDVKSR